MNNFKYNVAARFINEKIADNFIEELEKLGYKDIEYNFLTSESREIRVNYNFRNKYVICVENCDLPSLPNNTYIFNIDNKWEYEAALAIAAIRDDDKPYVGEWVRLFKGTWSGYKDKHDVLHKINVLGGEDRYSYEGSSNQDGFETNLNGVYSRKATPEEIIEFMKEQYGVENKIPTLPEKWAIHGLNIMDKKEFQNWYKSNLKYHNNVNGIAFMNDGFYHFPENNQSSPIFNYHCIFLDYVLITYEQWKEWYDYQCKQELKKYTIEELRKTPMWIKCNSQEEARKLGKYYSLDDSVIAWENFDFYGYKIIYVYIGHKDKINGGFFYNANDNLEYITKTYPLNGIINFDQVIFPEMKKEQISFVIRGPISQYPDLLKWFNKKNAPNVFDGHSGGVYYYDKEADKVGNRIIYSLKFTFIKYKEWKEMYGTEDRKIVGYKLIKEYPNSPALGETISINNDYTKTYASSYPEFWEPIYKKEDVIITVKGEDSFDVTVSLNNDIKIGKNEKIHIDRLRDIYKHFVPIATINGWECVVNTVDIGCKKNIPVKYLKEIIDAWEELNK